MPTTELQPELPETMLCLFDPSDPEVYVVETIKGEDHLLLFEALDDAFDRAKSSATKIGFIPHVKRIRVADITFPLACVNLVGQGATVHNLQSKNWGTL